MKEIKFDKILHEIQNDETLTNSFSLIMQRPDLWRKIHDQKISHHFISILEPGLAPSKDYNGNHTMASVVHKVWSLRQFFRVCRRYYFHKDPNRFFLRFFEKKWQKEIDLITKRSQKRYERLAKQKKTIPRADMKRLKEYFKTLGRPTLKVLMDRASRGEFEAKLIINDKLKLGSLISAKINLAHNRIELLQLSRDEFIKLAIDLGKDQWSKIMRDIALEWNLKIGSFCSLLMEKRIHEADVFFCTIKQAKKIVQEKEIRNRDEYYNWTKRAGFPKCLPKRPDAFYKKGKEWKSWGDFLGTGAVATFNRHFLPYEEAKKVVHKMNFKTLRQYKSWKERPSNIPADPGKSYGEKFISAGDFLGTGKVANQHRKFVPLESFLNFLEENDLTSQRKYLNWWRKTRPQEYPYDAMRYKRWPGWKYVSEKKM